MNVEVFALCDAAADYQGKLNILGTFDTIWTKQMPSVHPQCAVALRLRFSKIEEGGHKVKINIVDEDGKPVVKSVEGNINIRFGEAERASLAVNMILNLQGLKVSKYGEHAIDLAVDGRHEASLPLYVKQAPGPA